MVSDRYRQRQHCIIDTLCRACTKQTIFFSCSQVHYHLNPSNKKVKRKLPYRRTSSKSEFQKRFSSFATSIECYSKRNSKRHETLYFFAAFPAFSLFATFSSLAETETHFILIFTLWKTFCSSKHLFFALHLHGIESCCGVYARFPRLNLVWMLTNF